MAGPNLEEALSKFDYVRYAVCDFHGICRCKTLTRNAARTGCGPGMFVGTVMLHTDGDVSHICGLKSLADQCCGDCKATPAPDCVVRPLPWAGAGEGSVGIVMCEPTWASGDRMGVPQLAPPRAVARRLVDQLKSEFGLLLYHALEMECTVFGDDGKPLYGGDAFFVGQQFGAMEKDLLGAANHLMGAGIPVESLQTEYGPGQVEIVIKPSFGIEGADHAFLLKAGIKEMLQRPGQPGRATFMSRAGLQMGVGGSSGHMNQSLWRAADGTDAMYSADSATKLSAEAEHWLAGLLAHAKSLTAINCPTPNCYRRIHQGFTPSTISWAEDHRGAMVRVHIGPHSGQTRFENRSAGAAVNPYLALAGTLAAGMDGLRRKLPLRPAGTLDLDVLPKNLTEALSCLEADKEIVAALGEEFVEWYAKLKRFEVGRLPKTEADLTDNKDADAFAEEVKAYQAWI